MNKPLIMSLATAAALLLPAHAQNPPPAAAAAARQPPLFAGEIKTGPACDSAHRDGAIGDSAIKDSAVTPAMQAKVFTCGLQPSNVFYGGAAQPRMRRPEDPCR